MKKEQVKEADAQAEREMHVAARAKYQEQLAKLETELPTFASAARAGGDALDDLRQARARIVELRDLIAGCDYDIAEAEKRIVQIEAERAEAEQAERQAQLERLRAERDEAVRQFAAAIRQAGAALAEAGHCQDEIGQITHVVGAPPDNYWRSHIARACEGLLRVEMDMTRGRYPLDFGLMSRLDRTTAYRNAALLAD